MKNLKLNIKNANSVCFGLCAFGNVMEAIPCALKGQSALVIFHLVTCLIWLLVIWAKKVAPVDL
jgi:hypothetical protein